MTDAFYSLDGDVVTPSELTRGPWDPSAQHAGPPSALLARAIELCEPRERMLVGRMTVEILGPVVHLHLAGRLESNCLHGAGTL